MIRLLFLLPLFLSCHHTSSDDSQPRMTSITIVDRNGFTETITSKDRLQQYTSVDFSKPQPYQKVLRVYRRNSEGNVPATICSYHPNGQLKEMLEAKNNSASGTYREWHPSGQLKLEATVISGAADLSDSAKQTWLFDGQSRAWSETGTYEATIHYSKGLLEGPSLYYHPNGELWKQIPYRKGVINGRYDIYLSNGELLSSSNYLHGIQDGDACRYWSTNTPAAKERFVNGLLMEGVYYDKSGSKVASIKNGNGTKALFSTNGIAETQDYKNGHQEGLVKCYNHDGILVRTYHIQDGMKHGIETEFQITLIGSSSVKPKLSLTWFRDTIQGEVKTWYDNGVLESRREMSSNKKNGLSTAWYNDGSLMLIEEYDQDTLVKGEYYKKGDKKPVSRVWEGQGIATLYDAEGHFAQKVNYYSGKPQE